MSVLSKLLGWAAALCQANGHLVADCLANGHLLADCLANGHLASPPWPNAWQTAISRGARIRGLRLVEAHGVEFALLGRTVGHTMNVRGVLAVHTSDIDKAHHDLNPAHGSN